MARTKIIKRVDTCKKKLTTSLDLTNLEVPGHQLHVGTDAKLNQVISLHSVRPYSNLHCSVLDCFEVENDTMSVQTDIIDCLSSLKHLGNLSLCKCFRIIYTQQFENGI